MNQLRKRFCVTLVAVIWLACGGIAAAAASLAIDFDPFVALFNGKDLTGWEGDTQLWSARDGMIVGKSPGIKHNDFLVTTKQYENFELRLSFRLVGGVGNSGVQIRSARKAGSPQVVGYQADIGEKYWGSLYDEARRDKLLVEAGPTGLNAARKDGWNEYVIRCHGDHIEQTLNGVKTVDYRETDTSIPRSGIIGLQIHSGGPMEIQFKDLRIRTLGK